MQIEEACDGVVVDCNGHLAERRESGTVGNMTTKKKVVEKSPGIFSADPLIKKYCTYQLQLRFLETSRKT